MTIKEVSEKFNITQDTLRYYEKIGMIPPVNRKANGIRNYNEEDLNWVYLAKCMRGAGLPVEVMIRYVKLFREGDSTIVERLQLLIEQRQQLLEQREKIDEMVGKLTYKIGVYEERIENIKTQPKG